MTEGLMRMGFADPPYHRSARKHYAKHHKRAHVWDTLDRHRRLIDRLAGEFADGWALCCSSVNLRDLLPLCPPAVRVGAWVKPFSIFRPGVNPAYAWEPVIFAGGRPRPRSAPTVRDWVSCNITLRTGLAGSKPPAFCRWVFELLGLQPGDVLVDLFPGTGVVRRTWKEYFRDSG
jgi:hypothetical protein